MFLALLAGLELLRKGALKYRLHAIIVVTVAWAATWSWSNSVGGSTSQYLGPIIEGGLTQLIDLIKGQLQRTFFVAADGSQNPLFVKASIIVSTLLIAVGLATGWFRSVAMANPSTMRKGWKSLVPILRRRWVNSRPIMLALITFGFPIGILLRLTGAGWEIGARMSPFVFLGVGFVVAVSLVHYWEHILPRKAALPVLTAVLTTILVGGIVGGATNGGVRLPYKVSADALSIEPMGIETAAWTKQWLGDGNRFATDRVNRILVTTYGRQDVVTSLYHEVDTTRLFLDDVSAGEIISTVRAGHIDYLLVDLRLSTARPAYGHYYETYEHRASPNTPIDSKILLKFGDMPLVGRIFDNGWIVIFDVRPLQGKLAERLPVR
jgi:hypothetical protein